MGEHENFWFSQFPRTPDICFQFSWNSKLLPKSALKKRPLHTCNYWSQQQKIHRPGMIRRSSSKSLPSMRISPKTMRERWGGLPQRPSHARSSCNAPAMPLYAAALFQTVAAKIYCIIKYENERVFAKSTALVQHSFHSHFYHGPVGNRYRVCFRWIAKLTNFQETGCSTTWCEIRQLSAPLQPNVEV